MASDIRSRAATVAAALALAGAGPSAVAQVTTTYSYDRQGQVKTVTRAASTVTYAYDAAGNRVQLAVSNPAAPPTVSNASLTSTYNGGGSTSLVVGGTYTSLAVATGPSHGSASISGTTATYTPTSGYSGPDSFTYTATGPGGTSAPATVSVTVAAPTTLSAGVSATAYYRLRVGTAWQTGTPSSVTMTASGGTGPYTYAWERLSGDSNTTAGNASSATTSWTKSLNAVLDNTFTSTWRGKITDSTGQVAYTANVAVTIEYRSE